MSELNPRAVYATMQEDAKQGPLSKTLFVARIIAIAAAVGGAIPTATTFYQSWQHGVPFTEVSQRLAQYDLWVKNFNCKIDYRSLNTGQGTRVDVGACPKSGDIALKITTQTGHAAYEWIPFDKLQKAQAQARAAFWSLIATPAMADEVNAVARQQLAQATAPGSAVPARPAQQAQAPGAGPGAPAGGGAAGGNLQVICQTLQSKTQIIRVVNEGGKCYRESFSPFQGRVDKRDEVPCNTQCPPAKG